MKIRRDAQTTGYGEGNADWLDSHFRNEMALNLERYAASPWIIVAHH